MRPASPYLEVARPLALEAARRIMELRESPLVREHKADHSLVTNADHAADEIIRLGLKKAFPDHAVLTEESGLEGPSGAEFVWMVDPLDGTRAYAKGVSGFSVMIGLLRHGQPWAGVVVDPLEGHVYEAVKGEGATHTVSGSTTPLHVSQRNQFRDMPVVTSTGFPETLKGKLSGELNGVWVPQINSVGIKVGLVVRQVADVYINHHPVHYWDTCAPQIILEEAGGEMTFLNGQPLRYERHSEYRHPGITFVSNHTRHQDVLALLQRVMPPH